MMPPCGALSKEQPAVVGSVFAALQPPHLAAICPWEGPSDYYREFSHHAGILDAFVSTCRSDGLGRRRCTRAWEAARRLRCLPWG